MRKELKYPWKEFLIFLLHRNKVRRLFEIDPAGYTPAVVIFDDTSLFTRMVFGVAQVTEYETYRTSLAYQSHYCDPLAK